MLQFRVSVLCRSVSCCTFLLQCLVAAHRELRGSSKGFQLTIRTYNPVRIKLIHVARFLQITTQIPINHNTWMCIQHILTTYTSLYTHVYIYSYEKISIHMCIYIDIYIFLSIYCKSTTQIQKITNLTNYIIAGVYTAVYTADSHYSQVYTADSRQ